MWFLLFIISVMFFMVPTSTGKPGNMGVHFAVREKSGNFEHAVILHKIPEKSENCSHFKIFFSVIF